MTTEEAMNQRERENKRRKFARTKNDFRKMATKMEGGGL